ncbi:hypothetical protein OPT61_g10257 [Boeremia exigua]|uniref:Uncharacterized protein n=1 Tax=Boeremia exigua TaxID=749465 RepID=A0ACC2HQH9_9PLEO|nr:hypothetical protein OPT61_g10257 [Boeremia exigua]
MTSRYVVTLQLTREQTEQIGSENNRVGTLSDRVEDLHARRPAAASLKTSGANGGLPATAQFTRAVWRLIAVIGSYNKNI